MDNKQQYIKSANKAINCLCKLMSIEIKKGNYRAAWIKGQKIGKINLAIANKYKDNGLKRLAMIEINHYRKMYKIASFKGDKHVY